jgi:hypothetical protein
MNDFQFMPNHETIGLGSILFSWFALFFMWITPSQPLHNTFTAQQTQHLSYNTGANQVGEMFV